MPFRLVVVTRTDEKGRDIVASKGYPVKGPKARKSYPINTDSLDAVGFSYYAFLIELALAAVKQARELMKDDVVDENHELPLIEQKLTDAYRAI